MGKVRRKSSRRSRRRHQGGEAPINEQLFGSYPSKMSLGQGADFAKYHVGQHGGSAPFNGPTTFDVAAGPARLNGLNAAFEQIKGLQDGGRRRSRRHHKLHCHCRHCKSRRRQQGGQRKSRRQQGGNRKSRRRQRQSRRRQRRTRRRQGGALGYATLNASPMLLDSDGYDQAGLNPGFTNGVEFDAAYTRQAM